MSKKLTIYVDMDNTLLDTFVGAHEFAKQSVYGGALHDGINIGVDLHDPKEEDLTSYSTTSYLEACGMTRNEAVLLRQYIFHNTEYWATLPFMPGAEDVFRWMYLEHDVYIATSAFLSEADECILGKVRWIERNIPWFDMKHLIYSHAKYNLKGDIFIEDVWSQIETFDGTRILMNQPYNRDAEPDLRVYNWDQIKRYIETRENFMI